MTRAQHCVKQRGFTLAEVIMVVFILVVATGFLLLRTNLATPTRSADRLARQLYAYFKVVREQAILQPAVLGVLLTDTSYAVLSLQEIEPSSWEPLQKNARFWRPAPISQDISLTLRMNNQQVAIPLELSPNLKPQIYFMPSGEISDFELFIEQRGKPQGYRLSGNFAGQITLDSLDYQNG